MLVVKCNNTTLCYDKTYSITHCTNPNGTVAGSACDCYSSNSATATLCVTCSGKTTSVPMYGTCVPNSYVTYSCCDSNGVCYIRVGNCKHLMYICCGNCYYYSNPTSDGLRKGIPPGLYSGPTLYAILCRMIGVNRYVKTCGCYTLGNLYYYCTRGCYVIQCSCSNNKSFCGIGLRVGTAGSNCCCTKGCFVTFKTLNSIQIVHINIGEWHECFYLKANNIIRNCLYLVCICTPIFFS